MAIIRRFSEYPPIEVLNEIEAVNIVDGAGPAKIAGLSQGTVGIVGEFLKGPVNTPTLITSPKQLADTFGGASSYSNPGGAFPQQSVDAGHAPSAWLSNLDGNAYIAMHSVKFGGLVVVNVNQACGTTDLNTDATVTLQRATSGTAVIVPAGSRIKVVDSASAENWFATLDDAEFGSDDTQVDSIRVRRIAGSSTDMSGATVTLYDTPDSDTWTVTFPATITDLTDSDMDARYSAALDTLKADSVPANMVSIVTATRHDAAIMGYLKSHVDDVSSTGRGRIAVVAPPTGTNLANAISDTGVGVAVTSIGRDDRVVYTWPAIIKYIAAAKANYTWPGEVDLAGVISQTPPEENPAQPTTALSYLIGIESANAGSMSIATYKTMRANGICGVRQDKATGWGYQSGVTSVDPSVHPELRNIARRRMADFIEDSLANRWQVYNKKIMSEGNRDALTGETVAFLDDLKQADRIDSYSVDDQSGNTPDTLAQGVFNVNVSVRTYASMDAIVLNGQIGETVEITEG